MTLVGNPMQCPELALTPVPQGGVNLSDDMQQTLALLTAFWRNQRVVLKASPSGVLFTTSPQLEDIIHVTATAGDYAYQGPDRKVSEVMVMGHPDNTGNVWARSKVAATVNNSWPLAAKEVIGFSITNLNMLRLMIKVDTEKAIIAYTL